MLAEDLTVEEIRRCLDDGAGVDGSEGLIERLDLDPDEKVALSLAAWSTADPDKRHQSVPGLYLG